MTSPTTDAALERLRRDAGRNPLPRLDVAGVERRVLAEVARSSHSSAFIPAHRSRPRWPVWFAVGAAAGLVLFIATQPRDPGSTSSKALPERGRLAADEGIDGNNLALEQVIVATDRDVTVKHKDRVIWRLLANSRARIVENGRQRVTIDLDYGLLQADVVPSTRAESFAVEVGDTRVAVHGTVFSVERRGTVAEVIVREGKVMVGHNAQRGATQGTLLTAPSRAKLEVTNDHPELLQRPVQKPAVGSQPHAIPTDSERAPAATEGKLAPRVPLAERPSAAELDRAWSAVAQTGSDCFATHTEGSPSVRVSFNTQLTISVNDRGSVAKVAFEPPVAEPIRQCTVERIGTITTSPSQRGAEWSRLTLLAR